MRISSKRSVVVIKDVFKTTPEYISCQICKDFERDHGVKLTYNQAWHLKEKTKGAYMELHMTPTHFCLGYAIG